MDENRVDTTVKQLLPEVMASLEMLTVDPNAPQSGSMSPGNKRILRKRIPKAVASEILNRRCSRKPQKRKSSDMDNKADIEEYYLDKNLKRQPDNLETIFEEKEDSTEIITNVDIKSVKKYKRSILFSAKDYRRRMTMQALLDKRSDKKPEAPEHIG